MLGDETQENAHRLFRKVNSWRGLSLMIPNRTMEHVHEPRASWPFFYIGHHRLHHVGSVARDVCPAESVGVR